MFPSRTISLAINKPCADVYAFLAEPANISRWAVGTLHQPLQYVTETEWRTLYDGKEIRLTFTPHNAFGILDLRINGVSGAEQSYRIRVFPNGAGTELCLTALQRIGESDAQFNSEFEWVRSDLMVLKSFIEAL